MPTRYVSTTGNSNRSLQAVPSKEDHYLATDVLVPFPDQTLISGLDRFFTSLGLGKKNPRFRGSDVKESKGVLSFDELLQSVSNQSPIREAGLSDLLSTEKHPPPSQNISRELTAEEKRNIQEAKVVLKSLSELKEPVDKKQVTAEEKRYIEESKVLLKSLSDLKEPFDKELLGLPTDKFPYELTKEEKRVVRAAKVLLESSIQLPPAEQFKMTSKDKEIIRESQRKLENDSKVSDLSSLVSSKSSPKETSKDILKNSFNGSSNPTVKANSMESKLQSSETLVAQKTFSSDDYKKSGEDISADTNSKEKKKTNISQDKTTENSPSSSYESKQLRMSERYHSILEDVIKKIMNDIIGSEHVDTNHHSKDVLDRQSQREIDNVVLKLLTEINKSSASIVTSLNKVKDESNFSVSPKLGRKSSNLSSARSGNLESKMFLIHDSSSISSEKYSRLESRILSDVIQEEVIKRMQSKRLFDSYEQFEDHRTKSSSHDESWSIQVPSERQVKSVAAEVLSVLQRMSTCPVNKSNRVSIVSTRKSKPMESVVWRTNGEMMVDQQKLSRIIDSVLMGTEHAKEYSVNGSLPNNSKPSDGSGEQGNSIPHEHPIHSSPANTKHPIFVAREIHAPNKGVLPKLVKQEYALARINSFNDKSRTYEVMHPLDQSYVKWFAGDNRFVSNGPDVLFAILPDSTTVCFSTLTK